MQKELHSDTHPSHSALCTRVLTGILKSLVKSFNEAIGLSVVGCGDTMLCLSEREEMFIDLVYKLFLGR